MSRTTKVVCQLRNSLFNDHYLHTQDEAAKLLLCREPCHARDSELAIIYIEREREKRERERELWREC